MYRVYATSGGGVRIGATFGAQLEGEAQGKFNPDAFDYYIGTSSGALDATLTANGWRAEQKIRMFLDTDFSALFTPFWLPYDLRKVLALAWPISLQGLENKYASLCEPNPWGKPITFKPGLLINTYDAQEKIQVIYGSALPDWAVVETEEATGKAYTYHQAKHWAHRKKMIRWEIGTTSLPKAMARSATLPSLQADHPRFMDGAVAENPMLSALPRNVELLAIMQGYMGLVPNGKDMFPKALFDRFLYSFEEQAYRYAEHLLGQFENATVIYPKLYDIHTAAFDISKTEKSRMIETARTNTREQWAKLAQ